MAANKITKTPVSKAEATVSLIAAALPPAMASNALQVEDEFNPFYMTGTNATTGQILRPPYDPRVLERLTQENNTLGSCVEAMVVNVDGTGHVIELAVKDPDADPEEEDDEVKNKLEAFFKEPFPGVSFMSMRRDLRRDLERVGYGALEVMRNSNGKIVFLRNVPGRTIRVVKLDAPVSVKKTVTRDGVEVSYDVMMRERRFVQMMSGQMLFFKEFGATRDLHKSDGLWASPGHPVTAKNRATELIFFQVGQDPNSPYGVPRWEGQIPSVVGSRSAEEMNLTFLQSGGLPPALIIVQGGTMAGEARQALERQFAPGHKVRAAILEVPSSEGTIDKAGTVKVSVERFGAERANDSMFEKYDDKCFERVLRAFRIPSMFLGKTSDYNFATAQTSYLVAEAQVFGPERAHFDEIITRKLLPALGGADYVFKSKPIQIKDVTQQIEGLKLAAMMAGADPESLIEQVNEIAKVDVEFSQDEIDKGDALAQQQADAQLQATLMGAQAKLGPDGKPVAGPPAPFGAKPGGAGFGQKPGQEPVAKPGAAKGQDGKPAMPGKAKLTVVKNEVVQSVAQDLADRAMVAMRLAKLEDLADVMGQADQLSIEEQTAFRRAVAVRQFLSVSADPEGLGELAGCTAELMRG